MKVDNVKVKFDRGEPHGIRVSLDMTNGDMPVTSEVWHHLELFLANGVLPIAKAWLDGEAQPVKTSLTRGRNPKP